MSTHQEFLSHFYRMSYVIRATGMKRAIAAADPNPRLNFWHLILGNQLDIAVLEWCKVFGSDGEPTHWKKIVPASGHVSFLNRPASGLGNRREGLG